MRSDFILSIMKCNIIILLDEHNVAHYTVIKLTCYYVKCDDVLL